LEINMAAKAKRKVVRAAPVALAERWTATARATFLAELARTAHVSGAARVAGMPETSPYHLRQCDPEFRAAWNVAIEEGYQRLELLLLRRATFGEAIDGEDSARISTTFALNLLKNYHVRARRTPDLPDPMRGAVLRDRIEAKLAELNRRMGGNG
jgi:hypothetical protein